MDDKNIEAFGDILENTDKFSSKAVHILDDFNKTLQTYEVSIKDLDKEIHSASTDFTRITDNTIPVLKSLQKATKDFNRLTLEAEKSLNRGDYNIKETFEPMLVDIGILTEQLTDLTRELQQNPSGMLFRSRKRRRGPGE
jgi:phospholipid/cholesterol/gamma-HCH transport system substrate-binding protein